MKYCPQSALTLDVQLRWNCLSIPILIYHVNPYPFNKPIINERDNRKKCIELMVEKCPKFLSGISIWIKLE